MKKRIFAIIAAVLISMTTLHVLLNLLGGPNSSVSNSALAAPSQITPTVTLVDPSSVPNDLDTNIIITGTDFISMPVVHLGNTSLIDVEWVTNTILMATVPWGMDPGVYTLTVSNPGGESGDLLNAFTVTQAIGVWNAGELYGGSVEAIAVNPLTPTTIYAASSHVGLFRSHDGGENWSFQFAGEAVMYPVVDPHSPNRLYMHGPWTLYRSEDDGDTWTALDRPFSFTETSADGCPYVFIRPYVHPVSDTVFALACAGEDEDLFMSEDHGETWEPITNGITDTKLTALAFHPEDSQTMYAGTASGHIFISSNGGGTWSHVSKPVGCVGALAVDPFGSHNLWVASNDAFGDPCVLRTSTNPDLSAWETLTETEGYCSGSGASIYFDPGNSGTVFIAGLSSEVLQTEDGGDSWTHLGPGGETSVIDLALHPVQTDTIYLGDGAEGVYKTTDDGETWREINQGLTALYPQQLQVLPNQPDEIYAWLNNGYIYQATQGGGTWQRLPISRSVSILIDPITSTRIYAGIGDNNPYISLSDDGGQTWAPSSPLPKPASYADCYSFPYTLLAPNDQPGVLLAGVQHHCGPLPHPGNIYRSVDYGDHWQRVYTHTYQGYFNIDLATDAVTPTIIYAAIPSGEDGLLRSTDGGQSWERRGESKEGMEFAKSIAVEPVPPYRVYVMTSSEAPYLYVSEDHGLSWMQVTSPPDLPNVAQILSTGAQPSVLYAAGLEGLFRTIDGAQSWERADGVLGQVPIYSLATVTTTDRVILYAGTTGGYVGDSTAGSRSLNDEGSNLINAGVYRYTIRQLNKHLYLPMVLSWQVEQPLLHQSQRLSQSGQSVSRGVGSVYQSSSLQNRTYTRPTLRAVQVGGACAFVVSLVVTISLHKVDRANRLASFKYKAILDRLSRGQNHRAKRHD